MLMLRRIYLFVSIICFFLIAAFFPRTSAAVTYVPSGQSFGLPSYGTYISFAQNCTIDTASFREGGSTWYFINLNIGSVTSTFVVSTIGTNISVMFVDFSSWINYTTSGAGTQTFLSDRKPLGVYVDGIQQSETVAWFYANNTLKVIGALGSVAISYSVLSIPTPTSVPTPVPTPTSNPTSTPIPTPTPTPTDSPTPTPALHTQQPIATTSPTPPFTPNPALTSSPIPTQPDSTQTTTASALVSLLPSPSTTPLISQSQNPSPTPDQSLPPWVIAGVVGVFFMAVLLPTWLHKSLRKTERTVK